MKLTQDVVIASRYQLVDCLGAGAMGEVWRAQDTRFESRTVAVKFLREDESLQEDALSRQRLEVRLEQLAARESLKVQTAIEAIASVLNAADMEAMRAKIVTKLTGSSVTPADVLAIFDELVSDPVCNENARMRAKLRRLFRDEANSVANLRHDNIVSIFDYGDHEGNPYLVMDYIEGRTLYQVIQAQDPIARARRLQLIEDLCCGLGYAHKKKLVHRDIKPANLIIDGSTGSLKILDFGVVRRLGSTSTIGVPVGTFCYMSPEQTKGAASLDHRSDIFSVGLVFYELMSGRKAYPPGKSLGDLVARIQRDPPTPLRELVPSIPPAIEQIIVTALEKQPENRFQELSAMEREVSRIRARLEAEEQSERTGTNLADQATILKPRPTLPTVGQLLDKAEKAFNSGDDNAVLEICKEALTLQPGFAPALSLQARAESRQRDIRVLEVLQQADKLLTLGDLDSAKEMLVRAQEIDAKGLPVRAFEKKLAAALEARAAARERAEREREEQARKAAAANSDTLAATRSIAREGNLHVPIPRVPPQLQQRQSESRPAPASARPESAQQATAGKPAAPAARASTAIQPPADAATMPIIPKPATSAPAPPAPAAPAVPAARQPSSVRSLAILAVLASVIVLGIIAILMMFGRQLAPTQTGAPPSAEVTPPTPSPAPPPTEAPSAAPSPPAAPAVPAVLTTVVIDVRPWARVRIVPASQEVAATVPADPLYVPFTIELPPGDYTLECENGGLNAPTKLPLKVAATGPQNFVGRMSGFSPTRTVTTLLSQDR